MARLLVTSAVVAWWTLAATGITLAASPSVSVKASFSPAHLGTGTTVRLGFTLHYPPGQAPVAVTEMRLLLPRGLSIASSELGLANCDAQRLISEGAFGCPPNSLLGRGWTWAEVPFGSALVREKAAISVFSGALQDGHPQLLFLASANAPVIADIVFGSLVLPAQEQFGAMIDARLPLVASVPGAPNVALTSLRATIGPEGIRYREDVHGHRVSFKPNGILLPRRCPRGGFRFAVKLSFEDAGKASGQTSVPCRLLKRS